MAHLHHVTNKTGYLKSIWRLCPCTATVTGGQTTHALGMASKTRTARRRRKPKNFNSFNSVNIFWGIGFCGFKINSWKVSFFCRLKSLIEEDLFAQLQKQMLLTASVTATQLQTRSSAVCSGTAEEEPRFPSQFTDRLTTTSHNLLRGSLHTNPTMC